MIEQCGNTKRLSESASRRLAKEIRSGDDSNRTFYELNKAIAEVLSRREHTVSHTAQVVSVARAQAQSHKYLARFAPDVKMH